MRLLIVDDHALFREGLAGLLSYQGDLSVVGEAESADEAIVILEEVEDRDTQ